jgi:NAD(P)-dependent dehydrogenase (short-subunit alcohol dehydrogenase family)
MTDLHGRNALITGASQGFGVSIARAFLAAGANVVLCARSADQLEQTRQNLQTDFPNRFVLAHPCDVANADEVNSLVETARAALGEISILVNNAGIYGPMGRIEDVDWGEWTRALEINLYGTILPCRAVLPYMRKQGYGKIICISGGGATNPMPYISAYAASKAGMIRFAESLAEELRGTGIDVNSIAPGALATRLLDQVIDAGANVVGDGFHQRMLKIKSEGGTDPTLGANLCVFLASAESDGITAKLISAVWDPWNEFPQHLEELKGDIYTLRRIVPKDRGMTWGDR